MPFFGSSKPTGDVAPAPSQGPGIMGQMAATAGGVAVGNVAGTALTNALFGGSDENKPAPPPAAPAPVAPPASCPMHQQQQADPPAPVSQQQPALCSFEASEFVKCANEADSLAACQELLDTLKQCRVNYGLAPPA